MCSSCPDGPIVTDASPATFVGVRVDSVQTRLQAAVSGLMRPTRKSLDAPSLDGIAPGASRRRKLWQLDTHAHCPIVGVCLSITEVSRVLTKALGDILPASEYDQHCLAVQHARHRGVVSEALQRALDQRYAIAVQRAASFTCDAELLTWWEARRAQGALGEALWSVLTHPVCSESLRDALLAQVHMLQHQAGAQDRVDRQAYRRLQQNHQDQQKQLEEMQVKYARDTGLLRARLEQANVALMRIRADLIGRDTLIEQLQSRCQQQVIAPVAKSEQRSQIVLSEQCRRQAERIVRLQRNLVIARQEQERLQRAFDATVGRAVPFGPSAATPVAELPHGMSAKEFKPVSLGATSGVLRDQTVLCVGGRRSAVPLYRQVVERTGGQFVHHDGGREDAVTQLEASLAAADSVICQTGCISHDAYWRVKEHCKRTGKPCMYVDTPGRRGVERAVADLSRRVGEQESQGEQ